MKKLAIALALTGVSAFAVAGGSGWHPPGGNPKPPAACDLCSHDIVVKGPQIQVTALVNSASLAKATNDSTANNNMSSNTNGVLLEGPSVQITALSSTGVLAKATNSSFAQNNLASNIGSVGISSNGQLQIAAAHGSFLGAIATNGSSAVQNFSTNNACTSCD